MYLGMLSEYLFYSFSFFLPSVISTLRRFRVLRSLYVVLLAALGSIFKFFKKKVTLVKMSPQQHIQTKIF